MSDILCTGQNISWMWYAAIMVIQHNKSECFALAVVGCYGLKTFMSYTSALYGLSLSTFI